MAAAAVSHSPAAAAAAVHVPAPVDTSGAGKSTAKSKSSHATPLTAINDPTANIPTKEETAALQQLKAHLRKNPLKPVGTADYDDFFLLKMVIAGKCVLKKTLNRLTNYHSFRLKYKMDELTHVESLRWAEKNMADIFCAPAVQDGISSSFLQFSNFFPSVAADDEGFQNLAKCGNVYLNAFTRTLAMTRAGTRCLISMEGFGWKNSPISLMSKLAPLYSDCFPIRIVELSMLNPPMWVNAIITAFKMFMKKKISERITLVWDKGAEGDALLSNKYEPHTIPAGIFNGTNSTDLIKWLVPFAQQLDEQAKAAAVRRTVVFAGSICVACDSPCCDENGARIGGATACSVCGKWYCDECRDENLVERKGKGVFKHQACVGKKSAYVVPQ